MVKKQHTYPLIMRNKKEVDMYNKFKIIAWRQGRSVSDALKELMSHYIKHHKDMLQ